MFGRGARYRVRPAEVSRRVVGVGGLRLSDSFGRFHSMQEQGDSQFDSRLGHADSEMVVSMHGRPLASLKGSFWGFVCLRMTYCKDREAFQNFEPRCDGINRYGSY